MNKQHFMWVAILEGNAVMTEFEGDGKENAYSSIPRDKVTHFGLQSPRASYVIDLKDGAFHLKDYRLAKKISISLPIKNKLVKIDGPLGGWDKYTFFQYKNAYADFSPTVKTDEHGVPILYPNGQPQFEFSSQTTAIDSFQLGWEMWKNVDGLGERYVKTVLLIDNIENPKPVLKISLSVEPNGIPLDGSPFEISL